DVSGGEVDSLHAYHSSTVAFHARDFDFGPGLSLDGDRVLGTGNISGEWFDGTPWTVAITKNDSTIRAIPEPSALMLMAVALGGGLLLKKGSGSRHVLRDGGRRHPGV
ncbi:MAG: PEP-CTERM sorting domain-containing protein, partial [Pirellulaceae bacterium]